MIRIDLEKRLVHVDNADGSRALPFASREAFRVMSDAWLQVGWDVKHVYSFSWLGRPMIQLPEDMVRLQEVVSRVRPDVIIETGVAHGGSLVFHASLLLALAGLNPGAPRGRVIGVDVEIRRHNRQAIEAHPLAAMITLVEGSSTDPAVVAAVKEAVSPGDTVLVLLDSNHSRAHVLAELNAYGPLVTAGSYIVACDGIMKDLVGAPRSAAGWETDNPHQAAREFADANPGFLLEDPTPPFDESVGGLPPVTYWPGAWLRRVA